MNKIIDNYIEHELHKEFDKQCSTCFSERLQRAECCGLVYTGDLDLNGYPEFIGTQDQWEAFDSLLKNSFKFKTTSYTKDDELNICNSCSIPSENLYCDKCQYEIENGSDYYEKQD